MGPWKLISLTEAKRLATEALGSLPRCDEIVELRAALGRVTSCEVINTEENPPFDRSTVDGFAVLSSETAEASEQAPAMFVRVGEVRMGRSACADLAAGQAARIPTGGMVPAGADAVVMQEHTQVDEAGVLQVFKPVFPRENMICRGDDMAAGVVVIPAGCRIGAPELGVLASCGVQAVSVVKQPVVTVVTTGDEIIAPGIAPLPGQIRDVNSFTLSALAESAGCKVLPVERVVDSQVSLGEVLLQALQKSDVILISGGSSVGDRDFTTVAVQALPGACTLFHGVALKPGKPALLAMVGETAVFGIPGHTVAAMTVFAEIVAPALAARQGLSVQEGRFLITARLGSCLRADRERDEIIRVQLEQTSEGVVAWPLPAKSGLITVMSKAHGMIYTKAGQPEMSPGDVVEVQVLMGRIGGVWQGVLR